MLRSRRPVNGQLLIVVDEKLTGVGAELGLGRQQRYHLDVSPEFRFVRCRPERPEFEEQITVDLEFNRKLDRKQSLRDLSVKPAVKGMTVSIHGRKLSLTGPFRPGTRYVATVPGTLKTIDGQLARATVRAPAPATTEVEVPVAVPAPDMPKAAGQTLGESKRVSFEVPDRQANLRFGWRNGVLMPGGNLCLDVEAVNIPGMEFKVWRVHPINVVPHLTMREMDEVTPSILQRTVKVDLPRNTVKKLAIDLDKLLDTPRGVYVIRAAATGPRSWDASWALVAVTDLGISVKHHQGGLTAWVTSLKTGKPVGGVTVVALTRGNIELASGVTVVDGTARLTVAKNHPDGEPYAVTATAGEEFSYLELSETQWMIDSVDQSGRSHPGAGPLTDHAQLILGQYGKDAGDQPALGGREVDVLPERHQGDIPLGQREDDLHQMGQGSPQPVKCVGYQDVDPTFLHGVPEFVPLGSGVFGPGESEVDVLGDVFPAAATDILAQVAELGVGVLFVGADADVDGGFGLSGHACLFARSGGIEYSARL